MIDTIVNTGAAAFHFGNAIELAKLLPLIPSDRLVMGNVNPVGQFCHGTPESVKAATHAMMEACSRAPNFVISPECDIPQLLRGKTLMHFEAFAEF